MAVTASVQPESGRYGQRAARMGPLRPAYSQNGAVTASVQPEWGRIVYAASDLRHPFQLRFFPKKKWVILCKTDPDPIWMAWSRFGQTHGLEAGRCAVHESSGPVSGRTQTARYQFPTFRLGSVLLQTSRIILCRTRPDSI